MTLVLAALTPEAIVLAADGLCRKDEADGRTWYQEDLQKIFPLRDRAVAIVHHGQNIIKGREVGRPIGEFEDACSGGLLDALDVLSIAKVFRDFLEKDVTETLSELSKAGFQTGIGFWIGGILQDQGPRLYELFWPDGSYPMRHPSDGGATGRVIGGDGKRIVGEVLERYKSRFRPERLKACGVIQAQEYVRRLYHQTKQHHDRSRREKIIGGKYHELTILARGCEWSTP